MELFSLLDKIYLIKIEITKISFENKKKIFL